jgi:hypothetical protein
VLIHDSGNNLRLLRFCFINIVQLKIEIEWEVQVKKENNSDEIREPLKERILAGEGNSLCLGYHHRSASI